GPCRFRGSAGVAGEGDDVGAGSGEGGKMGPACDGPAADERDVGTHDSTWAATLRTAVATSSQSAAVKAAPTPTENDRATSASARGHMPMRYSTCVGCSAQCHGPPLPEAVRRSRMDGVAYTGRPPYIWADGMPSARSAATKRVASEGVGANHVMLEDPSPVGSGTRRRSSPSTAPTADTMRALLDR